MQSSICSICHYLSFKMYVNYHRAVPAAWPAAGACLWPSSRSMSCCGCTPARCTTSGYPLALVNLPHLRVLAMQQALEIWKRHNLPDSGLLAPDGFQISLLTFDNAQPLSLHTAVCQNVTSSSTWLCAKVSDVDAIIHVATCPSQLWTQSPTPRRSFRTAAAPHLSTSHSQTSHSGATPAAVSSVLGR